MDIRQFRLVLITVIVSVLLLSFCWEFWLEHALSQVLFSDSEVESTGERWEYVISIVVFVCLSLIYPYIIGRKLIERQQSLTEEITKVSEQDFLTGLFNRRKLNQLIDEEIIRCQRYKCNFSIIICDLDYFKKVNDQYGHVIGDKVLIEFAELLSKKVRRSDQVGRWGGEEFVIFCPQTRQKGARSLAEKLRLAVEKHSFDIVGQLTCSFGVAAFAVEDDLRVLLSKSDNALYMAKDNGRNRVEVSSV